MALKTCVIKALKLCPISIETLRAVQTEEIDDYNDTATEVTPENVTYSVTSDEPEQVEPEYIEPTDAEIMEEAAECGMTAEDEAALDQQFEAMQAQDVSEIF